MYTNKNTRKNIEARTDRKKRLYKNTLTHVEIYTH